MTSRGPTSAELLVEHDEAEPVPWAEAVRRLGLPRFSWLATTRPDGRPHVRPVLTVCVDGVMHTTTNPAARKAANLASDPRGALSTSTDGMDLVVEGELVRVVEPDRLERVAAAYLDKYGWPPTVVGDAFDAPYGAPTAGPPPYDVYELRPSVVFGFGTEDDLAPRSTRWRF